jgi:hypothetical protein
LDGNDQGRCLCAPCKQEQHSNEEAKLLFDHDQVSIRLHNN